MEVKLEHSCKENCSGWKQGFEQGEQKMYDHLKKKLDIADRMACFIKNRMAWLKGDWEKDAEELMEAYFDGDQTK